MPGKSGKFPPSLEQVREIARVLAIYHKYVKKFKSGKNDYPNCLNWILREVNKIGLKKNKDKVDKLALKEKVFFEKILLNEIERNYSSNILLLHSDIDATNVLFDKNKILAIIDFDNLDYGPRIRDVAISLRDS